MKIYKKENVLTAARQRIHKLFDEFPNIIVSMSGGKDSTVVFELCMEVAKEKKRLPLTVFWLDQEGEWEHTVEYMTQVMERKDVNPLWLQIPMVMTNNASSYNRFSHCWNEATKDKWIHPQHPLSIKENKYGTERFHDLCNEVIKVEYNGQKTAVIGGMRTEETPKRFISLCSGKPTYQDITWCKRIDEKSQQFIFQPIYDWSYTDVWKYIHEQKVNYNKIYDKMYQHGVTLNNMRVSNLHHETSIQSLLIVQEIEPNTWNRLVDKIDGASSIKHIKRESFSVPKQLPFMFQNWGQYATHLQETIVQDPKNKADLTKLINKELPIFKGSKMEVDFWKMIINTILSSDWDFTKFVNFTLSGQIHTYRRFKKGKAIQDNLYGDLSKFTAKEIAQLKQQIKDNEQRNS